MQLSKPELQVLKDLVLGQHCDWKGLEAALKARDLTIGKSSRERFFSGKSTSLRTLRKLALSLGTTPDGLVNQVRILASSASRVGGGKVSVLNPLRDPEAFRVAYQLWVEMTTRKLGLSIDPAQDVVMEIYDSWYSFFKSARELIKAIPLHKDPRSAELRRLVDLSQAVLNDGLRPHLQRWQARFRHWAASAGNGAPAVALSPQEAQQRFPEWAALRDDLLATNQRLISYVCALEVMISRRNSALLQSTHHIKQNAVARRNSTLQANR